MKRKLIWWTMAAALAALIAIPILAGPNPKPAQAAGITVQGVTPAEMAKHPGIRDAMRALETAKKNLQDAPAEFGGHRAKAVVHINAAIEELKYALVYAQKHNE
jgi:hypothetical protein